MIVQVMVYPCQQVGDARLAAYLRHGVAVARQQPDVSAAYLILDSCYQTWLVLIMWQDHDRWQHSGKPFQHVFLNYLKRKTLIEALCTFLVHIRPRCCDDEDRLLSGASIDGEAMPMLSPATLHVPPHACALGYREARA